ncbi:putative nuclease HARBI1 [Gouania willdenowi]|uniref:putative nuclease HARBI1 n=1 Tax=Gouania willdenowi TaxID=441366 RepID=UPI0010556120|nr:putative nuclease HARBI1 [Gouania willdenowi]
MAQLKEQNCLYFSKITFVALTTSQRSAFINGSIVYTFGLLAVFEMAQCNEASNQVCVRSLPRQGSSVVRVSTNPQPTRPQGVRSLPRQGSSVVRVSPASLSSVPSSLWPGLMRRRWADYVNRKSFHSINVQVQQSCDASYLITNVEAKWPGSVHDSRIYRECSLSNRFASGHFDGYLLGDRGYPCLPTLMTPYPDPGPQLHFNVAHSRTRARVENTIGILKARFQCLKKLRVTPARACDIIVACVILHNIAIIRAEPHPAVQPIPEDDHPFHPTADAQDGRAIRDIV